jgi:hypothetical protein
MANPTGPSGDSFLTGHGAHFPQEDVVVIHGLGKPNESRHGVRAHVQARTAFFDVDAPVYEGDFVEIEDPRGGVRRVEVIEVKINDVRGAHGLEGMSHIEVVFSN